MPVAHTLYIMMEVCKGLQYAHDVTDPETGRRLGIVHRDISPPNILISQARRGEAGRLRPGQGDLAARVDRPGRGQGQVQLPVARGGAAARRSIAAPTSSPSASSSTSCSPASACSTARPTTRPSSWCGRRKVPPIAAQNPEVTPELEQVVRKALARDLNQRYQTAGDLQDALAQYLFSQRLKVTAATSSSWCRAACAKSSAASRRRAPVGNLIDTLINEEIVQVHLARDTSAKAERTRAAVAARPSTARATRRSIRACSSTRAAGPTRIRRAQDAGGATAPMAGAVPQRRMAKDEHRQPRPRGAARGHGDESTGHKPQAARRARSRSRNASSAGDARPIRRRGAMAGDGRRSPTAVARQPKRSAATARRSPSWSVGLDAASLASAGDGDLLLQHYSRGRPWPTPFASHRGPCSARARRWCSPAARDGASGR